MVFDKVCDLLTESLSCPEERLSEDTVIQEDLECTVEDLDDFLMSIDEEFGVTISEDDLAEHGTVGELSRFIEDQL